MNTEAKIWDKPTRIIHWVVAISCILNIFALEKGEVPHQLTGYTAVTFMFLRVFWGFNGSHHSRFSSFPIKPKQIFYFVTNQLSKSPPDYPGHNPLAALVYIAIWSCILGLGTTGWMMGLDTFWEEKWLKNLHGNFALCLQIMVLTHFLGMITDSIRFRRNTWLAMIRGRRT